MLYDSILSTFPQAGVSDLKPGRPAFLNATDVRAVVRVGGFVIGIESQGDPWCKAGRLDKSLAVFVELRCNVIVCATRTSGGTVEAVEELERHGYSIEWRHRPRMSDENARAEANRAEAEWMLEQIRLRIPPMAA